MGYQRGGHPRRHLPRHRRHLHPQRHRFRPDDEKRHSVGARYAEIQRQSGIIRHCRLDLCEEGAGGTEDSIAYGFWFLVSGFWFLVSGFWFLVSGFWFLVSSPSQPGTRNLKLETA